MSQCAGRDRSNKEKQKLQCDVNWMFYFMCCFDCFHKFRPLRVINWAENIRRMKWSVTSWTATKWITSKMEKEKVLELSKIVKVVEIYVKYETTRKVIIFSIYLIWIHLHFNVSFFKLEVNLNIKFTAWWFLKKNESARASIFFNFLRNLPAGGRCDRVGCWRMNGWQTVAIQMMAFNRPCEKSGHLLCRQGASSSN